MFKKQVEKYLQRILDKTIYKVGDDDVCETKGRVSSKEWPLVKNEKSSMMET